jgi:hypothetical protein
MRTTSRRRNGDEAKQRAAEPADRSRQAADRPANQRYYTVISRAVTEQGENTFSSREALYERARAAQMVALQKYHPSSLAKDDFDRERLALEQAIDQVEQENAITLSSSAHLGTNGSELRLAAKAQKLGAVAANRGQLSRSKSLLSFL